MGEGTSIEWVTRDGVPGYSWNPWWGCQRVSPGCGEGKSVGGCYAETFSKRLGLKIWGPQAPRRFFGDAHWAKPLAWERRAKIDRTRPLVFCASMADVFEDRDDLLAERARLFELIRATPRLVWLLLTKRPQNIKQMVPWGTTWPENVWIGTTVEDQKRADERLPHLVRCPASIRFVSAEPLLEPIGISFWLGGRRLERTDGGGWMRHPDPGIARHGGTWWFGVDWLIVGAESGHGPRPMHEQWVRNLRDHCAKERVAFFYKQQLDEKKNVVSLPMLDGRQHAAFPEVR